MTQFSNGNDVTQCDYLTNHFGLKLFSENDKLKLNFISPNLLNILHAHRGLEQFDIQDVSGYYLYTGRGPTNSSFHIGHLLGLNVVLDFQKAIKNKIYFMISDDEKMLRDGINYNTMQLHVKNTIEQLRQLGFSSENTNIHINTTGMTSHEYKIIIKLMSMVTLNELNNIFGEKLGVGEYFYVFYQLMPCFVDDTKQCVVIAGIDQDPFFRLARHLSYRLHIRPPIIIYTKNVPGLDGSEKMSTSVSTSTPIFINDTIASIKKKIMSIKIVGAGTLDELFANGSNLEKDIPFILIDMFDSNRNNVELIRKYYGNGGIVDKTIEDIIPPAGIKIVDNKMMITTFGVRLYLIDLLVRILKYKTDI